MDKKKSKKRNPQKSWDAEEYSTKYILAQWKFLPQGNLIHFDSSPNSMAGKDPFGFKF
jgi:hypothetical protein